jgi:hypothetical protein
MIWYLAYKFKKNIYRVKNGRFLKDNQLKCNYIEDLNFYTFRKYK